MQQKVMSQRDIVLQQLRERGCRITKQREILLDIILKGDCACCKEIYYKAVRQDPKIGTATVYSMINTLEEIGAIDRKNMYRVQCRKACPCTVHLENETMLELSEQKMEQVIRKGLVACGYAAEQEILDVKYQMECS